MINRIIPFIVFLFVGGVTFAQNPVKVDVKGNLNLSGEPTTSDVCDPGDVPAAGSTTQSLGLGAMSNDVQFLCFGDTLFIDHDGMANFDGDPDGSTDPGIVYSISSMCPPQVSGPDLTTIKLNLNFGLHLLP